MCYTVSVKSTKSISLIACRPLSLKQKGTGGIASVLFCLENIGSSAKEKSLRFFVTPKKNQIQILKLRLRSSLIFKKLIFSIIRERVRKQIQIAKQRIYKISHKRGDSRWQRNNCRGVGQQNYQDC